MLTQKMLKEVLEYDPATGIFVWLKTGKGRKLSREAGSPHNGGYLTIGVDGRRYLAQRLVFLYMLGEMPEYCDHINRDKSDNRWVNLRPATRSQNGANRKLPVNNTSGYRGVCWHKEQKKWLASISVEGKQKYIGLYDCKHHAFCEYVLASREAFGKFSAV